MSVTVNVNKTTNTHFVVGYIRGTDVAFTVVFANTCFLYKH